MTFELGDNNSKYCTGRRDLTFLWPIQYNFLFSLSSSQRSGVWSFCQSDVNHVRQKTRNGKFSSQECWWPGDTQGAPDRQMSTQHLIIILWPEEPFTSFILPDLDLTRKSSRSPRPETASNLSMEPMGVKMIVNYRVKPGNTLRHVSLSRIGKMDLVFGFLPEYSLLLLFIDIVNHRLKT